MKQHPPAPANNESASPASQPKHPVMVEDLLHSPKIGRALQKLNENFFRNVRAIVMIFIGLVFVGLIIFLYNNVYLSLIEANAIVILRQEVATEKIDLDTHREIKNFLESRKDTQPQADNSAPLLSGSNTQTPPSSPETVNLVQ